MTRDVDDGKVYGYLLLVFRALNTLSQQMYIICQHTNTFTHTHIPIYIYSFTYYVHTNTAVGIWKYSGVHLVKLLLIKFGDLCVVNCIFDRMR